MMPRRSGYEVCQRIRERADWRHIKVVMLSAKGRDAEVNKGLSIGADVYVTKPFSTRELMAGIKQLLDQGAAAEHRRKGEAPIRAVSIARFESAMLHCNARPITALVSAT